MKKLFLIFFTALIIRVPNVFAQQNTWPKEIPLTKTGSKLMIYQPQPDALEGNTLTGRAAIAGKGKAKDELVLHWVVDVRLEAL